MKNVNICLSAKIAFYSETFWLDLNVVRFFNTAES